MKRVAFDSKFVRAVVESCPLGTGKMESPQAIPQDEGLRERTESTTSNYFSAVSSFHKIPLIP